ncbi:Bug family tripartite tricarboxylate transporter substrate binding protein [Aquabacterium sp. J223]|uniref:Bug family tripartite tricarboxylate transporter substrate binding protein n=1 Tax=Aquabacterium sp. J223 TaxID=2898431 RepID=UPI0021ADB554|nr:tripartite tricarboxylate transporter substrate binding protein [Aquabacterium sp. J223]UUX96885.1 tripartite tricarboxylate transporter substrate binding protein [Aquabacterium sp. J223]
MNASNRRQCLGTLAALALTGSGSARAAANLKVMIGANPGGGYDQTGRGIGKALQEAGVAGSVTYENKGGAGGTIALAQFANAAKGDPNALLVVGAIMVGAIVQNKPPITLAQVTPIARLFAEYNVFVVPAASPIRTMREVVEQMKKEPASVKWGGGSRGSVDHISVAMIARENAVDVAKVNYVPFKGGGEAVAAVLGGHVTCCTSGLAEMDEFIRTGKLRAIAVTAPQRLKGVAIPTLKEQGIDVEIGNWRGVYGAAGITPEQRRALIDGVARAVKTKAWAETLEKNNWTPALMTGDEFGGFVDNDHARLRALMLKLGML